MISPLQVCTVTVPLATMDAEAVFRQTVVGQHFPAPLPVRKGWLVWLVDAICVLNGSAQQSRKQIQHKKDLHRSLAAVQVPLTGNQLEQK